MDSQEKRVNLAIIDDHNLFRKGLIKLINLGDKNEKYKILFEAENGAEMKEKLSETAMPDIILMDISMPDIDGYESVAWLKEKYPELKILVISMFESEEAVIKMLRLGVNGYLSKDIEVEDMHLALETVAHGGLHYSGFVSQIMTKISQNVSLDTVTRPNPLSITSISLSENERHFLELACTDLTYEKIADKMFLSPKTIDGYRGELFKRFGVKNRIGMAMYAVKNGLLKPD